MMDVEPFIVSGLDRLVPVPSGAGADWEDVLGRAGETRRHWLGIPRPGAWSRLQVAVVVAVIGLMLVGAATATYVAIHTAAPSKQQLARDYLRISYPVNKMGQAFARKKSWSVHPQPVLDAAHLLAAAYVTADHQFLRVDWPHSTARDVKAMVRKNRLVLADLSRLLIGDANGKGPDAAAFSAWRAQFERDTAKAAAANEIVRADLGLHPTH